MSSNLLNIMNKPILLISRPHVDLMRVVSASRLLSVTQPVAPVPDCTQEAALP